MADIMLMGKNPHYLGSWDLEEISGREAVLTIDKIVDEEVFTNGQKETCTVCYWTDKNFKPMILNVTNKKTIAKPKTNVKCTLCNNTKTICKGWLQV